MECKSDDENGGYDLELRYRIEGSAHLGDFHTKDDEQLEEAFPVFSSSDIIAFAFRHWA